MLSNFSYNMWVFFGIFHASSFIACDRDTNFDKYALLT